MKQITVSAARIFRTARTLVSLTAFTAFVGANVVSASASGVVFNGIHHNDYGNGSDFPNLQVARSGESQWAPSTTAKAGDVVNVFMWDHNSGPDGSEVARNVFMKISLPTDTSTSHTLTSVLTADNAVAPVTGSAVITTLPANTKLAYIPGSAKFFRNINDQLTTVDFPTGVNGDDIVTNGIHVGDQLACWHFSQAVTIQVKITEIVPEVVKPTLTIQKDVRKAGIGSYTDQTTVNPGEDVEYKITVKNTDTKTAAVNVKITDVLPEGVTYVGPLALSTSTTVVTGVNLANGSIIAPKLEPNATITATFKAHTATTFKNAECSVNTVTATSENGSNSPVDSAKVCFTVPTPVLPTIELIKTVRKAGTDEAFREENRVNPSNQVEYQISVRNPDGSKAVDHIKVQDFLPTGMTYVGPTYILRGTSKIKIADGITGTNGFMIDHLAANETVKITFIAGTDGSLAQDACVINKAIATSPEAANQPEGTAKTCIDLPGKPVATPTPITAIPTPTLPRTGPEAGIALVAGLSGAGTTAARYYNLKRKLRKNIETLDIR